MEVDEGKGVAGKKRKRGEAKAKLATPTSTPVKMKKREKAEKEVCKYGVKCYQTNEEHRKRFSHRWVRYRGR